MPLSLRWQDAAIADLEGIRAHITEQSPRAAVRVAAAILRAAEPLSEHPELGRAGRVFGTRELILGRLPYLMVYRISGQTVEVHRVLHMAMQWPRHEE